MVDRVVSDVISDPEIGALALAKSKLALASFSRAQEFEADGIGIGIASRAGYDPYGAVRFLTSMEHNSELKPQQTAAAIDPRAPDFLSSHPATPERITNAVANARQYAAPAATGASGRDKTAYLGDIDGIVFGEDPSEGFVRGRRFLHPRSASPSPRRKASIWKIPRRPCSASSMAAARRCGSTWCGCRPSKHLPIT